jgi:protein gp37
MDKSKIEWTDATWNPVRGCSIVSAGCTNCYAMRVAHRSFTSPDMPYHGLTRISGGRPVWNGDIKLVRSMLRQPLVWKRPRRIFVNSMSDLFHEKVPFDFIDEVFEVMLQAHWHTYQILTKRPERMLEWAWSTNARHGDMLGCPGGSELPEPPKHIHLGVSAEDQETADRRIHLLSQVPAAVRWVSFEPLLGDVNIQRWAPPLKPGARSQAVIEWAVIGGESGPGARPMHPNWVRHLRNQCVAAGVPFFFKQWGDWFPIDAETHTGKQKEFELAHGARKTLGELKILDLETAVYRCGKRAAGRLLDGRTWDEYPV